MDKAYWAEQINAAQEALEEMGQVDNLRLILWMLLVDRVDTIAMVLQEINNRQTALSDNPGQES